MDMAHGVGLLGAAAGAGGVDAIVGGGGLIQLPALLLAYPALPAAVALGTNKFAAISGTSTAAATYLRRTKVDRRVMLPAAALAVVCAGFGAVSASRLPTSVFRPIVMVLLVCVAAFVVFRPTFGAEQADLVVSRRRRLTTTLVAGVGIGFYDGIFGPGTGTFLIICFAVGIGTEFVAGSAMAKVVNVGTNFGALVVFATQGHVMWLLGAGMGVCNLAGARIGARLAIKRGAGFVRVVLLVVVVAMVVKMGFDQFG
ncbi:putative membrane protein YfcA [Catenulispora sp. MAP12-49]|uniref:TSUP family transporter n=1 Tax=Catenulispora sp. MAP12-49 TaxID=3156302 RepID=UPI0035171595